MLALSSFGVLLVLIFSRKYTRKYNYMNFPIFIIILFTALVGFGYIDIPENIKVKFLYMNIVLAVGILIYNRIIIDKS